MIRTNKAKKKKKSISVASRKDKARRIQKWACEQVSVVTGLEWGEDKDICSRPMGQKGVDVVLSPLALKLFPWSIECKWTEQWDVPAAIRQAKANQHGGTNWLVIMRKSNDPKRKQTDPKEEPVAVLDACVFFELLYELQELRGKVT